MTSKLETVRDSGWAWVVVAGTGTSFLMIAGFFRGFGVFYASLVDEFGGSASATSLIQGFRFAAICVVAPIASWMSERFTERAVLFVGAASFSSALMVSYFAPNLEFNVLTLGAMTGVGMACILTPGQIAIGKYFDKYRSLANSICFCGSSLGMTCVPPLVIYLIEMYGLRGSLLIYGGFLLNCFACAALVRPFRKGPSRSVDLPNSFGSAQSFCNVNKCHDEKKTINTKTAKDAICDRLENAPYNKQMAIIEDTESQTYSHNSFDKHDYRSSGLPEFYDGISLHSCGVQNATDDFLQDAHKMHLTTQEDTESEIYDAANHTQNYSSVHDSLSKSGMFSSYANIQCIDGSMYLSVDPMYLGERETDTKQNQESENHSCPGIVKGILDFSLFRDVSFMMFLMSTSFAMISISNVTIYIIPRAEECNISRQRASLLLTIVGGCDIVGRLVLGFFSDIKKIGPHRVMMVGLAIMGIGTILLPLAKDFNMMVVYAVVYGLIGSAGNILCLPIVVLFVGTERMPRAMGLVTSFHGIASALSPPILGYIKDTTGSYDSTFYVCGACQLIASSLMLLEPFVRRCDKTRGSRKTSP